MPKPRCRFYPSEIARRHCPAIDGPISSRACREKYIVELECPKGCPHIELNMRYETERSVKKVRHRLESQFTSLPSWTEDEAIVLPFMAMERILAAFGQWYPDMTDGEVLDTLEDYEVVLRAKGNRLEVEPRIRAGRGLELRTHLERKIQYILTSGGEETDPEDTYKLLSAPIAKLREAIAARSSDGGRGYLDFIIPFAEKADPKPVKSRLILP